MRDAFRELVSGWTLIHDVEVLGERIEAVAAWAKASGPLLEDEQATIELMVRTQVVWGIQRGDFEPYFSRDTDPDLIFALKTAELPR